MSDFVPFRQSARFEAGLVGSIPGGPPVSKAGSRKVADPDMAGDGRAESGSPDAETSPEDGLPKSQAELDALIEAALADAKSTAESELAELQAAVEAERTALACLVDNVDDARSTWAREVRAQLGEVILVGVRQIVAESAELQSVALQQRIAEVGERLIGEQQVFLRVRSEDAALAKSLVQDRDGWSIVVDDELVAGGCIAETEGGQIDATMGAAFSGLSGSVKEWMDGAEGDEE